MILLLTLQEVILLLLNFGHFSESCRFRGGILLQGDLSSDLARHNFEGTRGTLRLLFLGLTLLFGAFDVTRYFLGIGLQCVEHLVFRLLVCNGID